MTPDLVRACHAQWRLRVPRVAEPYRVMEGKVCVGVYADMGEAWDHLNALTKGAALVKYMEKDGKLKLVPLTKYKDADRDFAAWIRNVDIENSGSPDFESVEVEDEDNA